jgi:hypothetical protein
MLSTALGRIGNGIPALTADGQDSAVNIAKRRMDAVSFRWKNIYGYDI